MNKIQKVAIIGAGIAGISCARVLRDSGRLVTLFDKSTGPGGRISHRLFEQWGADHGAQYFTAKGELFKKEVNTWMRAKVIEPWLGKIVSINKKQIIDVENLGQRFVGIPTMNSLAKYLVGDITVKPSHTISKIFKSEGGWNLFSNEKGQHPESFDLIVIAIPPKQARSLLDSHYRGLSDICVDTNMLPCWTLIAFFDKPLPLSFDGAFIADSPFSWIARDNSKPGRFASETWIAQANHEWSKDRIEMTNYQVEPELVSEFEKITGQPCKLYQSHLWRYARVEHPRNQSFHFDATINIALCGDWFTESTIEGAWTSGYRLGKAISTMIYSP
jgi:predicted NAD/FAD-dependent oxidoreductase